MTCFKRFVYIFLFITLFISESFSYSILEVCVPDYETARNLYRDNFDIIGINKDIAYVKGWERDIIRLDRGAYSYNIFIEDFPSYTRARLGSNLDDMGGYMTLPEINEWINLISQNHSDIISPPDTIGFSYENRPIILFKISDNPTINEENEPEIYLNAAIHADEVAGPYILNHFCEIILADYGSDARITSLVNNHEIWIQMVCNPDSYYMNGIENPDGGGGYRYNQRPPIGVDLNRNWPIMWEYGCDDENSGGYHGEYPASEPEVAAMMSFIETHDIEAIANYHACGNELHIPWGHTPIEHPDYSTYMAYANYVNETLGYAVGGPQLMYILYGGARDWQASYCIDEGIGRQIWSILFEVGFMSEDGVFVGHWPSIGMMETYAEAHIEPLKRFIEYADSPATLLPPQPSILVIGDTLSTNSPISWINPNEQNIQFEYDIYELDDLVYIDHANTFDTLTWEFVGFEQVIIDSFQGIFNYHDVEGIFENSMTSRFPYTVQENDTFRFITKYSISNDHYGAHVQISLDGINFTSLEGNITDNSGFGSVGSYNRGHRIHGFVRDWIDAEFPLDEYINEDVFFRIVSFGYQYNENQGIYVDNISPVQRYLTSSLIYPSISDTFLTLDYSEINDPVEKIFSVLTTNPVNSSSVFSKAVTTIIDPDFCHRNEEPLTPNKFNISDVYPNPFNPSTTIQVTIPERSNLTIVLHDILGREVKTVIQSAVDAGAYTYNVDASDLASGLYFLVVNAQGENGSNHRAVKKAILMK